MIKVNEKEQDGLINKYYDVEVAPNPVLFIENLINNNIKVTSIYMEEDTKLNMKLNAGYYTLELLKEYYHKYRDLGLPLKFYITGEYNNCPLKICFRDNSPIITLSSDSSLLELTDIIKKEKNVKQEKI